MGLDSMGATDGPPSLRHGQERGEEANLREGEGVKCSCSRDHDGGGGRANTDVHAKEAAVNQIMYTLTQPIEWGVINADNRHT